MAGEWAKVGARCVCKDTDGIAPFGDAMAPIIGRVYTISKIEVFRGNLEIELAELPAPDHAGNWYLLTHFRPIVKRTREQDLEQFNHLLNASPLDKLDRLRELLDES